MPKFCYVPKRFEKRTRGIIDKANTLLEEYAQQGYSITLRSLYYRFVANGWLPNKQKSYKRLVGILTDARLAGLVDWHHLIDRTRNLSLLRHYSDPQTALKNLSDEYHIDLWKRQDYRPEVWIEKDALVGVIERVCDENDVPYFSCRGYTSISEMWGAAMRLGQWKTKKQTPYIIHFGDHDPSGMDMSRDIVARIQKTFGVRFKFKRVALNMDQIDHYDPPPNPAKQTDSRFAGYSEEYGDESWELDALPPPTFREIIEKELNDIRDDKLWKTSLREKVQAKERLAELSKEYETIPSLKRELDGLKKEKETLEKKLQEATKLKKRKKD